MVLKINCQALYLTITSLAGCCLCCKVLSTHLHSVIFHKEQDRNNIKKRQKMKVLNQELKLQAKGLVISACGQIIPGGFASMLCFLQVSVLMNMPTCDSPTVEYPDS